MCMLFLECYTFPLSSNLERALQATTFLCYVCVHCQYMKLSFIVSIQRYIWLKWKLTSTKTVFYDNFVSFWMRQSKHLRQLGLVIPKIHVTLDHFPVTLDISCNFGQCHKRPCFLLVTRSCMILNTNLLSTSLFIWNNSLNSKIRHLNTTGWNWSV